MGNSSLQTSTSVLGRPQDSTVAPATIAPTFGGFFRNKIINGDFSVWQRGIGFNNPNNGFYTADRWLTVYDGVIGNLDITRGSFFDDATTALAEGLPFEVPYYLRWNQSVAGGGSFFRQLQTRIENVRTLAGKRIVLSFWARADANRNVTTSVIQNFGADGSSESQTMNGILPLTTSWQFFTSTIDIPGIEGKEIGIGSYLAVVFDLPINVTMVIDFALVQLEQEAYTSFDQRPPALELQLCRRYLRVYSNIQSEEDLAYDMYKTPTASGESPIFYEAEVGLGVE